MFGKNLTSIKDDLALLSLNIQRMEGLEDAAKTAAISHLQKTLGLLRFGDQRAAPKKIKLEEGVVLEPATVVNQDDALFSSTVHEDVVAKLYNGLKPVCDICGADFASVGVLSAHVKNYHGNKEYVGVSTAKLYNGLTPTCEVCGATFATVGELSTHVKTCHGGNQNPQEGDFICLRCNQPFSSRAILESHTKNPANCEKILKIRERLRERQTDSTSDNLQEVNNDPVKVKQEQYDDQTFSAGNSGASYEGNESLISMEEFLSPQASVQPPVMDLSVVKGEHPVEKLYQCEVCFKEFIRKETFRSHKNIHTDRFKCSSVCGSSFQTKQNLMSHLKNPENCHTLLKKREILQEEGAHKVDRREKRETTLMQVESSKIQNMDQEQNTNAENEPGKVDSSEADGLEMWDSSSNTYTKVGDDTSVEFSGDSEREEALHDDVVGDISTHESVGTEIQSTAEMCELSVTAPTPQQSGPEEDEREEQESEQMDEDSDSEFEMFSCERCDKYFVSQESLDSHKNECK